MERLGFAVTALLLTISVILHHYALSMMQSKNQTLFNIAVLGAFMPAAFNVHLRLWMMAHERWDLLAESDFPSKGGMACDFFNLFLVLLCLVGMLVGMTQYPVG